MSADFLPLRYLQPKTVIEARLLTEQVLVTEGNGTYPGEDTSLVVAAKVVADRSVTYETTVDVNLLEQLSLAINLSEDGYLDSIAIEASRDLTPVVDILAKVAAVAATVASAALLHRPQVSEVPRSYEDQWADANKSSHDLLVGLEAKIAGYQVKIVDRELSPIDTVEVSAALNALYVEYHIVDSIRRDWIAARASTTEDPPWTFDFKDLVGMEQLTPTFDAQCIVPDAAMGPLIERGFAIATTDTVTYPSNPQTSVQLNDEITLRRARSAELGVYTVDGTSWTLDPASVVRLDIVDPASAMDDVSLRGSWFRTRTAKLDFYPDRSLKTYAVTTTPSASAIVKSAGGLLDVIPAAVKIPSERLKLEVERAKNKLELLKTASETAKLAAGHAPGTDLASLKQAVQLDTALGDS